MTNWELMLSDLADCKKLIPNMLADGNGNYCAIGYLMKKAGGFEYSRQLALETSGGRCSGGFDRTAWDIIEARYNSTPDIHYIIVGVNNSAPDETRVEAVRAKIQEMRDLDEEYQAMLRTRARDSIPFSVLPEESEQVCEAMVEG